MLQTRVIARADGGFLTDTDVAWEMDSEGSIGCAACDLAWSRAVAMLAVGLILFLRACFWELTRATVQVAQGHQPHRSIEAGLENTGSG